MADNPRLHPADTASTLNRLTAIGERMATEWKTASDEITRLAGQLGKGELGAAFLAGYQQAAADTARAIDQCCQQPHQLATTGTQAVTKLAATDHANRQAIQQPGDSDTPGTPLMSTR